MGMFDSLIVQCPGCGKDVEFQSKAGDCLLKVYNLSSVPLAIAHDLDGEEDVCLNCHTKFTIQPTFNITTVAMVATKIS